MKKLVDKLFTALSVLITIVIVVSFVGCKHYFWRVEHPDAPTWRFFIPDHR